MLYLKKWNVMRKQWKTNKTKQEFNTQIKYNVKRTSEIKWN